MIAKACSIPLKATLIEALLNRLVSEHPKRVALESELGRVKAGFRGEQSIHSILAVLPPSEYVIFHDIRLPGKLYHFQIDLLVLSATFFLILEVKNMVGELYFDGDFKQLIRTLDDQHTGFDDPILQVNLQRKQLQTWLTTKKIPPIPIETVIVSAHSKAVLRANNKDLTNMIIRKNSVMKFRPISR